MPTKEKEAVVCASCGVVPDDTVLTKIGRYSYCPECTRSCDDCGNAESADDSWTTYDDRTICDDCRQSHYRWCEGCDMLYGEDNFPNDSGYCSECDESESVSIPWRRWRECADLTKGKKGEVMMSTRLFGVELETSEKTAKGAIEAISVMHPHTGVASDSGIEFQTPPASGDKAETVINTMCDALKKHDFRVGNGQGLHVHIDARDMKDMPPEARFKAIRSLWLFYIVFDKTLQSFINKYRRSIAKSGSYCKSNQFKFEEVATADCEARLEQIWYETQDEERINRQKGYPKDSETRYRGLNLHTLFHALHPEIRYHEATLSAREILEWANLHCLIMDKAVAGQIPLEWLLKVKEKKMKRKAMFDFLDLPLKSRMHFTKTALKKS